MMNRLLLTSSTLLLLLCICVTLCQTGPVRCCTKYSTQALPLRRLKDYKLQDVIMTCNIEAVIFTTVKGKLICANPKDKWVQKAISYIQKTNKSE